MSKMPDQANCFICGKEELTPNEVGLNKKLISQDIMKYHCLDCLAEYLEIPTDDLLERVQEFKDSGCPLFE
jgi:uncharacterized protein YlaI